MAGIEDLTPRARKLYDLLQSGRADRAVRRLIVRSEGGRVAKLSVYVRGSVRQFAYWLANRSAGQPVLDGIDYGGLFDEPSGFEAAFAVYLNVLEVDADGVVTNGRAAEERAAQFIRGYCDPGYVADPPFADAEVECHPGLPDRLGRVTGA